MTREEFDNYLTLVSQMLQLRRDEREEIGNELRDHLENRVAELVDKGMDKDKATKTALAEFGDATALAGRYQMISNTFKRRWMMRFATYSVAGSFLAAILLMCLWPENNRFGTPELAVSQDASSPVVAVKQPDAKSFLINNVSSIDKPVSNALAQKITFAYDDVPFQDLMDDWADRFKINIVLDQSARDDSLSEDEPVTIKVVNLPFSNALNLMLREKNATYIARDGVLRIISMDVADDPEFFITRIYDVRKLLMQVKTEEEKLLSSADFQPETLKARQKQIDNLLHYREMAKVAMERDDEAMAKAIKQLEDAGVLNGNYGPKAKTKTLGLFVNQAKLRVDVLRNRQARIGGINPSEILVSMLKITIAPDDWDDSNGDGTAVVAAGMLVVSQTQEVHHALDEFLTNFSGALSTR